MLLLLCVLEVLEEIGVEDGRAYLVVARGPLAEVDGAAAVGAEGDVGVGERDFFAADGALEDFSHGTLLDDAGYDVVVVGFGDFGSVEGAGDEGFVGAEVVDEDLAVDLWGLVEGATLP
jgi:hypothetical protein